MQVPAPFGGLVVVKRIYRNGNFVEIAEGDEVRPGTPVVDIVDTSVMRVSAKLNQADARFVRSGQAAKIGLDGFPELLFDGRIETRDAAGDCEPAHQQRPILHRDRVHQRVPPAVASRPDSLGRPRTGSSTGHPDHTAGALMALGSLLTRGRVVIVVIVLLGLAAGGRFWFGRMVVADSETATVTEGVLHGHG